MQSIAPRRESEGERRREEREVDPSEFLDEDEREPSGF